MSTPWPVKSLSEVCEIRPAKSEIKGRFGPTEHVSFIPMKDLAIGKKNFEHSETREIGKVYSNYTYFANGDVLLAKITPCFENGKLGIAKDLINGIGFGSSEYFVLRPREEICNGWIYYYLSRQKFRIEGSRHMTGAVGHKRVSKQFIENYKIPVPPKKEQQRIINMLDRTFDNINFNKNKIVLKKNSARELSQSLLTSVFDGEGIGDRITIGELCKTTSGSTPSKSNKGYHTGGTIPWLLSGEVDRKEITESKNFITELALENTSVKLFPPNTVLVAMYGATAGQVGILRFSSTTNQAVCGILPNENIIPEYLYYALKNANSELVAKASGSAQPNLSQQKIKALTVSLPSLEYQKIIIQKLDSLSASINDFEEIFQQELNSHELLKQSILQEAFNGNL